MRIRIAIVFMMILTGLVLAQDEIPLVTLQEINQVPDSVTSWVPSPLEGQLVRVRGQVSVRPIISDEGNRNPILSFGTHWGCYIQGPSNEPWGGLNIYAGDSASMGTQLTGFDICDTAKTYEFTGVITPYGQAIELVLKDSVLVELITEEAQRYDPIPLTLDSLFTEEGTFNYKMRKYLGMQVIFTADDNHPLIVSDIITGTGSSAGGFRINDEKGQYALMYAQSRYFKTGSFPRYRERADYNPPPAGSYLGYIKGILEAYNNQWEVVPCYPEDLGPVLVSPPSITNVRRDLAVVAPTNDVTVSCKVEGRLGAQVTSVYLHRRINLGLVDSLLMTKGVEDTTIYTVVIPAVNLDSAFVDFFIKATDSNDMSQNSPQNLTNSRYSYFVLNRPLTVQDIRYSPFGSAYSSYHNYKVQISGVVTADTSDIPGNHGVNPARVYMQNGSGKWSGILLGTGGLQVTNLKRGDHVTVEGTVGLGSLGVKIDTLTSIVVNSSNNPLPEAVYLPIDSVGTFTLGTLSAEPWEGTLVKYQNVVIDSANADGNSNFGESFGKEVGGTRHTRIIWSDGNTSFNAGASAVKVVKGDSFQEITGVLSYTHSQYKLTPRKNDDIFGYVPVGISPENNITPTAYSLNQNFPNPFNPSTVISYAIPHSGMVTLKIYNILGQEVRTLVNQIQNSGNYKVTFDASSLTSGIYFYSLATDNFVQVKKMILVK